MPLYDGDPYIGADLLSSPFDQMQNAVIAIEATNYLQHMMDEPPAHEPLLAALGGEPIALKLHIHQELDRWKENKMRPLFVFDGQSVVGKDEMRLRAAKTALNHTKKAWELYAENQPSPAVKAFGSSGAVRAQELSSILQEVLVERDLEFIIAPFSACAQLAYLDTLDTQYIDGIMGSQELLLYDIYDSVMTPPSASDWEKKAFLGFSKSELIKKLNISREMFDDALLMVGTSFLPPFPPLYDPSIIASQPFHIQDAVNLLRTSEKSISQTCTAFSDILQVRDPNWLDKFRKAQMGIRHSVTISVDGATQAKSWDHLTSDNVEYLGLQLPSELYHYMAKSLISPRLCNAFGALEFITYPTLDGVDSEEYRRLVRDSLPPLKATSAALVSSRIHRGFQFKNIKLRFWFDASLTPELAQRTEIAPTNSKADTWGVKGVDLKAQESTIAASAGNLSFALLSLQDKDFPKKTISKHVTGLKSEVEVTSNALWRLLHIRGYVNDQHELTSWGKALATTLKAIGPVVKKYNDIHHIEEAAFLAYELIRFDILNSRNRHTELIGGPLRGSEDDKGHCILVGRAACLLKLRHKDIGYTGPLSKNFLSFYSTIKAVRETDRDLLEAIAASMFLNNQASRDVDDAGFRKIGRSLPFATDINVGLGIAVKTYLDDYLKLDTSTEERAAAKLQYADKYLPNSVNIAEDLDVAFNFFDALYEGVKTLGDKEVSKEDLAAWAGAKEYLAKRK